MTRTFIALELDTDQQHFLGDVIRQGKQILPDLHWVEPDSIHLTLAFLGELNNQQLQKAMRATRDACASCSPFTYQLSGLGTFGPASKPRVLWMGVIEQSGTLNALHKALSLALVQQGFTLEKRPFSPHLTLARVTTPLNVEQLQQFQQLPARYHISSPTYHIAHLYVMKSELTRTGALYTCLETCPFKQG